MNVAPAANSVARCEIVLCQVRGAQPRLFVCDQPQPTLIVNDLKTGATARGGIALWLDVGTDAHFRNLTVTPEASRGAVT